MQESHFQQLKPSITRFLITKHFKREAKDAALSIAVDILNSRNTAFEELHKFEGRLGGNWVFRAKLKGRHVVYAVTSDKQLILLRYFKNFKDYKRFLEDKQLILRTITNAKV